MKYIVKTRETEFYDYEYMVEAKSEDEAEQKVLNEDWDDVEIINKILDREILESEPFSDN